MNFRRAVIINRPVERFSSFELSDAQIESIILAGLATPIPTDLYKKFHITFYKEQSDSKNSGPVNIVISLKDEKEQKESKYLFAGMIMGQMQLAVTSLLLGYKYITDSQELSELSTPDQKEKIGIPTNYTPIQKLQIGYPAEEVRDRDGLENSVLARRFV